MMMSLKVVLRPFKECLGMLQQTTLNVSWTLLTRLSHHKKMMNEWWRSGLADEQHDISRTSEWILFLLHRASCTIAAAMTGIGSVELN